MNHDLGDESPDVIIVGAGIMGSCLAYYLSKRGVRVLVIDRSGPAAEASGANAGMVSTSSGLPESSLTLSVQSAKLYESAELELEHPMQFHRNGKLLLAFDSDGVAGIEAFERAREGAGLSMHMLSAEEVREIEPNVSGRVIAGLLVDDDAHIDPIGATVAFLNGAQQLGATYQGGVNVEAIVTSNGRATGVSLDGEIVSAPQVVIAAGSWATPLAATAGVALPVEPGRGQLLITEPLPPITPRVIFGYSLGFRQLDNGGILFGSTVEFVGYRHGVESERLAGFAQKLVEVMPGLAGHRVQRVWAGLRPMTPDNLPIIGPVPEVDGLFVIAGHGTVGMGMGPASAYALAEFITTRESSIPLEPYAVDRFRLN